MTSTVIGKLCARCSNGKGIARCNGCYEIFCLKHFNEHRNELSKLMDNINEEYNDLRNDLCEENVKHSFLSDINKWEEESIMKIKTVAKEARTKLQQIFIRKKDEIKFSFENLTEELCSSQKSKDYTEMNINKWTEKLKTFRETLENWSNIHIEYDNHTDSFIRLIKICEQQFSPTTESSEESVKVFEEKSFSSNEKFDKTDGEILLSEGDLIATCRTRLFLSSRFIYGINRYSSEKHNVHFHIRRKGETPLFFGIITSSETYQQSIFGSNNPSVYGWWELESFVINGKLQGTSEENIFITGDKLILTLDCNNRQILLQHQRTKRLLQIPIKIEKCPFPWKILIGLSNFDDCIHIIY